MTATEEAAANSWSLMFHHAMPARLALDFVQETGIDREQARSELLWAASRWLKAQRPESEFTALRTEADSLTVIGWLHLKHFDIAEKWRKNLVNKLFGAELQGAEGAGEWIEWCDTAARVIALCRELHQAV